MKMTTDIRRPRIAPLAAGIALAAGTILGANAQTGTPSQRTVVTFAAASFAEAGRGDKLKAWVEKFNQSNAEVEIRPVTIPFSSFVTTIFTQMAGKAGPDLVRFDLPEFFAAVDAKRVLPIDDLITDAGYQFTAPDKYMKVD
jgi:multiple sugar transport system substrate-binding protein